MLKISLSSIKMWQKSKTRRCIILQSCKNYNVPFLKLKLGNIKVCIRKLT